MKNSITPRFDWPSQSAFRRPFVSAHSAIKGARFNSAFARPYAYGLSLAEGRDHQVISFVVRLLYICSPTAIIRLIVAVKIVSLYRMLWRGLRAHVFDEIKEIEPALTDDDSAATVVSIESGARVSASSKHIGPCSILGRGFPVTSIVTVSKTTLSFCPETAARLDMPSAKVAAHSDCFAPAVAYAFPPEFAGLRLPQQFDNRQFFEAKAQKVLEFSVVSHLPILAVFGGASPG